MSFGCEPVDVTGDHHFTLYRSPGTFTSTAATTTSSQDSEMTTGTASPASSISGLESQPQPTADDSNAPTISSSSSGSKAWIAGAAAGPVLAILALGFFAFWWKRRRAKRLAEKSGSDGSPETHEAPVQSPKTDEVSELPWQWSARLSELPTTERAVELQSPSPVFEVE